jgi:pSer/pThr/pTyr-binding forkhead associated (FHA) protein
MSGFVITFTNGERRGQVVLLADPLLLGRSRSAGLQFTAPEVSGKHLRLELRDNAVVLTQVGSGKTWVNGAAVAPGAERILAVRDAVAFAGGNAFTVLSTEQSGAGDAPTASSVTGGVRTAPDATIKTRGLDCAAAESDKVTSTPDEHENWEPSPALTHSGTREADDETKAMETRPLLPDEEQRLRDIDRQAERKRIRRYVGLIACVGLAIGGAWLYSSNQLENPLTWPVDASGEPVYADQMVDLEGSGQKDVFGFFVPGGRFVKVDERPERVRLDTRIGKRQDVPCRITLERVKSLDNLTRSRDQGFAAWKERKISEGGQWTFEVLPGLQFAGKENGVPYLTAKCTRDDNGVSWSGFVQYMRIHDWELVLFKEIPKSEWYRGARLMEDNNFLLIKQSFVKEYWEADGGVPKRKIKDSLDDAAKLLAPAVTPGLQLGSVHKLLRDALVMSAASGDSEAHARAMGMLLELRRRQNAEFNNWLIAIKEEKAAKRDKQAAYLTKMCLDVFNDENDKRYHDLRRGEGLDD